MNVNNDTNPKLNTVNSIDNENFNESHITYNHRGSVIYEYITIDRPYLILYETVNIPSNISSYMEFTEDNKCSFFTTYDFYRENRRTILHSHDFYEITYVLSGTLSLQIENEYLTYTTGDCCLCNKNIHHREIMDQNTEIVLFLLSEEYVKSILEGYHLYDNNGKNIYDKNLFTTLFSENSKNDFFDSKVYIDFKRRDSIYSEDMIGIINQMISEITRNFAGKTHMMKAMFSDFFARLEDPKLYKSTTHAVKLSTEEQIIYDIAISYEKKPQMLTRADIEKITGYNSDYVERIIKKHLGVTLSEYGKSFILQRAANLLSTTNKGIGDICQELGYSNRNYFNTIFKNKYGMTPSEYKKHILTSVSNK